ncbi:glycosyltransferase 87 family protein [Modestobacter versicolor]|uniref:glycosyltransferase 87 family protein n=1 Tax=Modestobacter versicolor TaxID=429133 RepID=UPI0034DF5A68
MTPTLALLALLLVGVAGTLLVVSGRREWRPSLLDALLVALAFRVALFVIAKDVAPYDLLNDFRIAGENVLAHQDPTLNSRPRGWSYLPTYAFLLAGMVAFEEWTGLPWLSVARVLPICFDLGVVVLVWTLGGREKGGLRAFQYACTPIAFFVSAVHGQMEPLCLLFALAAFLAARPGTGRRALAAGALLGLAVSVKTWPLLFLPALLIGLPTWRARGQLLLGGLAVGLTLLLTMPLTVGTPFRSLPEIVSTIVGYNSAGGTWGWSAIVFLVEPYTYESFETSTFWATVGRIGSLATLAAIVAAVWWWRRAHPVVLAGVTASVFQVTTAGHGAQYLAWPAPFTVLAPTRLLPLLQVAIGVWAWWAYIGLGSGLAPAAWDGWVYRVAPLSSLVLVALIVLALPWRQRRAADAEPAPPADEPEAAPARA